MYWIPDALNLHSYPSKEELLPDFTKEETGREVNFFHIHVSTSGGIRVWTYKISGEEVYIGAV